MVRVSSSAKIFSSLCRDRGTVPEQIHMEHCKEARRDVCMRVGFLL